MRLMYVISKYKREEKKIYYLPNAFIIIFDKNVYFLQELIYFNVVH